MMGELQGLALSLSTMILPVVIAITLHEAAHGWVAWKLGDDTARRLGRVTFNPFPHIDKVGTVLVPIALFLLSNAQMIFGWAKPVPVDTRNLRRPKRDMVLVAIAGPGINVIIAIISAALFHLAAFLPETDDWPIRSWVYFNLGHSVFFNLLLAVFNMLPIPPLDGGRVIVGLLPDTVSQRWARIEPYGIFIVVALFFIGPFVGGQLGIAFNPAYWLLFEPASFLSDLVGKLVLIR